MIYLNDWRTDQKRRYTHTENATKAQNDKILNQRCNQ